MRVAQLHSDWTIQTGRPGNFGSIPDRGTWHLFRSVQASSKLTIPPIKLAQSDYFGTGTSNDQIIPFHRGVDRATNAKKILYVFRTILSDRSNILNPCLWSGSNFANNLVVVVVVGNLSYYATVISKPETPQVYESSKFSKPHISITI